jgi:hypothetical protein
LPTPEEDLEHLREIAKNDPNAPSGAQAIIDMIDNNLPQ